MTQLEIFQVDAFSNKTFGGNPAAVCPLEDWLPDETLQNIALENNLSETAFFVPTDKGFHLRWFTPTVEVDLCGHATLATAFVIFDQLDYEQDIITFETRSGDLHVHKKPHGLMMDFPVWTYERAAPPAILEEALGHKPDAVFSGHDWIAYYEDPELIKKIEPNMDTLAQFEDARAVIVTAEGKGEIDFISRFFGPRVGVPEDPVTGSAHCILTPFWADKLDKTSLRAYQASARGGNLLCELKGERVEITGQAVLYMKGTVYV